MPALGVKVLWSVMVVNIDEKFSFWVACLFLAISYLGYNGEGRGSGYSC